jgi:phosphoribosyl 1,2-cyclic phosphodiesterase
LRQPPLIFDAGFGLRSLGRFLRESARTSGDIFLTHTHLDHIIGFPFFGQHTTGRDQGTPMTLRAHKMVAHASQ